MQAMAIFTTRRTLTSLFSRIDHHHHIQPFLVLDSLSLSSTTTVNLRNSLHKFLFDSNHPSEGGPNFLSRIGPESFLSFSETALESGYAPFNDLLPDWSYPPPGCDNEHWLIVMEFPTDPKPSEDQMVDSFVKTLASIIESEEAKKKIYSLRTTINHPCFGALISEELSKKLKGQPGVLWVLPDFYHDVPNKDYGGDLFIDGKLIPRPQFKPSSKKTSYDSNSQVFKGFSWNNFLS